MAFVTEKDYSGRGEGGELTPQEEVFIQNLAAQCVYDSSRVVRLNSNNGGSANRVLKVDNSGNYLVWGSINWGEIVGDLSNQTDLQNALNLKANDSIVLKKDGSVSITSNWNVDGANTLYIDKTNGRVGIGNTAPTNPLDIHINSNLPQNDLIRLTQDGAFASAPVGISFFNSAGGVQMASIEAIPGTSYSASQLRFFVANSSKVRTQRMVIDVNGNVGIATTSPTAKLHIQGTTGYNQLRLATSYTPTSSSDTNGNVGDVAWDDNFIYIKTSSAGWKRASLSTF
jgi:hypothetical protein